MAWVKTDPEFDLDRDRGTARISGRAYCFTARLQNQFHLDCF
jgi:hypothetical protein